MTAAGALPLQYSCLSAYPATHSAASAKNHPAGAEELQPIEAETAQALAGILTWHAEGTMLKLDPPVCSLSDQVNCCLESCALRNNSAAAVDTLRNEATHLAARPCPLPGPQQRCVLEVLAAE